MSPDSKQTASSRVGRRGVGGAEINQRDERTTKTGEVEEWEMGVRRGDEGG